MPCIACVPCDAAQPADHPPHRNRRRPTSDRSYMASPARLACSIWPTVAVDPRGHPPWSARRVLKRGTAPIWLRHRLIAPPVTLVRPNRDRLHVDSMDETERAKSAGSPSDGKPRSSSVPSHRSRSRERGGETSPSRVTATNASANPAGSLTAGRLWRPPGRAASLPTEPLRVCQEAQRQHPPG
jgi:hypothetical protein